MFFFKVSTLLNRLSLKAMSNSLNLKYYLNLKRFKFVLIGKFFQISILIWEGSILKKKNYVCCITGINYDTFNTVLFGRIPLGSKNFFDIKFPVFSRSFLYITPSSRSKLFFKAGKAISLSTNLVKSFYTFDSFLKTTDKSAFVKKSKIFFFVN